MGARSGPVRLRCSPGSPEQRAGAAQRLQGGVCVLPLPQHQRLSAQPDRGDRETRPGPVGTGRGRGPEAGSAAEKRAPEPAKPWGRAGSQIVSEGSSGPDHLGPSKGGAGPRPAHHIGAWIIQGLAVHGVGFGEACCDLYPL